MSSQTDAGAGGTARPNRRTPPRLRESRAREPLYTSCAPAHGRDVDARRRNRYQDRPTYTWPLRGRHFVADLRPRHRGPGSVSRGRHRGGSRGNRKDQMIRTGYPIGYLTAGTRPTSVGLEKREIFINQWFFGIELCPRSLKIEFESRRGYT